MCVGVEYAATAIRHASARGKFVDLVCAIWGIWFGLKSQVSSAESRVPAQPGANTKKDQAVSSSSSGCDMVWSGNTCDQASYL